MALVFHWKEFCLRSHKKELLDLKEYTPKEYEKCLKYLGRIGRLLGAQKATLAEIKKYDSPHFSILDVGCGGGDFAATLAKTFPNAKVVGTDIDEDAIAYAKKKWAAIPNLSFLQKNIFDETKTFTVVTMTLVCHHLTDDELKPFLQKAKSIAERAVIINDLERSWIAYLLFALITPLLFPSRLIFHDGLLSIRRSFKKKDWNDGKAKKVWPFRWLVTLS